MAIIIDIAGTFAAAIAVLYAGSAVQARVGFLRDNNILVPVVGGPLLTNVHGADERVEQLLELLSTGGDELARNYYRAAFISRETMRLGLAVPLHPAAARYHGRFREDLSLPLGTGETN